MMFWIQARKTKPFSVVAAPMNAVSGLNTTIVTLYDQLFAPGGMAIDLVRERVFWTDVTSSFMSHVYSCDFDGGNRTKTKITHVSFMPKNLQISQGTLYWTGQSFSDTGGTIFKVRISSSDFQNENLLGVRAELVGNLPSVQSFTMYPSSWKKGDSRHESVSQFRKNCTGLALTLSGPRGFTCACPKGMDRTIDGNCGGE